MPDYTLAILLLRILRIWFRPSAYLGRPAIAVMSHGHAQNYQYKVKYYADVRRLATVHWPKLPCLHREDALWGVIEEASKDLP